MLTQRTSVHSTFIKGKPIGGLNGGTPGLLPLAESGQLKSMLLMQLSDDQEGTDIGALRNDAIDMKQQNSTNPNAFDYHEDYCRGLLPECKTPLSCDRRWEKTHI